MTENKRFEVILNEFDEVEYIADLVDYEDRDFADFIDFVEELAKENKELIQFKEQVLNLIDKKLEENKELDGVDTAMYYANKQTLNELKKELQ